MSEDLFDRLGGMPALEKVHTIFYDKLLSHSWLKDFLSVWNAGIWKNSKSILWPIFLAGLQLIAADE